MKTKYEEPHLTDDPHWYKDAVIYELHVRAFYDSNADGIGDFAGLMEKLDYLQDLGITAIWLLPFYPSPLRDDGYDIADYANVNPAYGTRRDFRRFLTEAHRRGLRVITELVLNHTSSDHAWFQRARRAPHGSKHRDFYVWSDTPERYQDARIIFKDFETSNWTWDPVAHAYYWHRFYSHQPDLNFESVDVQRAVFKTLDFWMSMGVDGMRLDAVPYLYEREGTNCENLPETHEFLKEVRAHIDRKYKNRMLLAEANQWPDDASAYFGDGDECHMNFHFPVMPRLFMAVQLENSFPIVDILDQTPRIPESCQWAVFLRNHDELTLEMVTDEDRDYMYRVYAAEPEARINLGIRRRLAPLLKVRRKIELMNGLLFSLPGTPVIYYGDEIGMGDNIYLGDRDGVRTPMQWSGDRNAGFSRANPQKLYLPVIIDPEYHYEALNVEAQQNNPTSLLWWMKRLIALRKQYKVFGRGDIEFLHPENPKVLAFVRSYEDERVLVVANLSRFVQYTELDLSAFEGLRPVELFGGNEFPFITSHPYFLTLGPHTFYWFALTPPHAGEVSVETPLPELEVSGRWENVLKGKTRAALEKILLRYVPGRRWFRGKARKVTGVTIVDAIPVPAADFITEVLVLDVAYAQDPSETYVLPVAFFPERRAREVEEYQRFSAIARLRMRHPRVTEPATGILADAFAGPELALSLLSGMARKRAYSGRSLRLQSETYRAFRRLGGASGDLHPVLSTAEQTNTSVIYGDRFILKLIRRLEEGENPEVEIGRFLTERAFPHTPPLAAALTCALPGKKTATVGILQGFVRNQGDAWRFTLDALDGYFERALAEGVPQEELWTPGPLLDRARTPAPEELPEVAGAYLPIVRLLAQRTAELHLTLAAEADDPAFAPEPFSILHQRALYESLRARLKRTVQLLRTRLKALPPSAEPLARMLLDRSGEVDVKARRILDRKIKTVRIRCHGDYHLGQVLYTGKDFLIIDFEGEPGRSIGERRLKRSALRDVAGMLRSFHYAVAYSLRHGRTRPEDVEMLQPWARLWREWVPAIFLSSYLEHAGDALLPAADQDLETLIDFYLIDKCVYEIEYELNNRPEWVEIPLTGLWDLLAAGEEP